jgi:hypothetical protein
VLVDKLGELNPVLTKNKDNSEVVITNAPDILSEITTDGNLIKVNLKSTLEKRAVI